MTYQVITLDERNKSRAIWGTFHYPSDNPKKVISFLRYLEKAGSADTFLVHELETDRAFSFLDSLPVMVKKLSEQA